MSLPTAEQEPVSGRIKLTSDMIVGISGSIMELYDRIQKPAERQKNIDFWRAVTFKRLRMAALFLSAFDPLDQVFEDRP